MSAPFKSNEHPKVENRPLLRKLKTRPRKVRGQKVWASVAVVVAAQQEHDQLA